MEDWAARGNFQPAAPPSTVVTCWIPGQLSSYRSHAIGVVLAVRTPPRSCRTGVSQACRAGRFLFSLPATAFTISPLGISSSLASPSPPCRLFHPCFPLDLRSHLLRKLVLRSSVVLGIIPRNSPASQGFDSPANPFRTPARPLLLVPLLLDSCLKSYLTPPRPQYLGIQDRTHREL